MKKTIYFRIIALIMILLLFPNISSYASNTVVVIDGSGSVAGMSKTRQHNSIRFITEELTKCLSDFSAQDTISLIHFTDKIQRIYTSAGYNEAVQTIIDSLRFIPKGNTSFSIALDAINEIPGQRKIVFISDGLNNAGTTNEFICNQLEHLANSHRDEVYFLLLDDEDTNNSIIQCAINSDNITLVKSLSEISFHSAYNTGTNAPSNTANNSCVLSSVEAPSQNSDNNVEPQCYFEWKYLKIILLVLVCVAIIILFGYLAYQLGALFVQTSAGAMQKAIFILYCLPKGLFNMIYKKLPNDMKTFLTNVMPRKGDINVGEVKPGSEQQAKALDAMRRETGKAMRHKNGEIDFDPVSKFKVKLRGSLDSNIPETLDPRTKVFMAQEAARDQMLKSKKGRKLIAQYVGKSPAEVNIDDYTCWKDDMRNFGKPTHNPLTPHETIDGQYIMWVPKKYHDVSWGGVSHSGGVSLLKSIRNYLNTKA